MNLKLLLPLTVFLVAFLTLGSLAQQFGGDNISYTGDGVTIWDFSRAVPAALACAAVVIVQVKTKITVFEMTFRTIHTWLHWSFNIWRICQLISSTILDNEIQFFRIYETNRVRVHKITMPNVQFSKSMP